MTKKADKEPRRAAIHVEFDEDGEMSDFSADSYTDPSTSSEDNQNLQGVCFTKNHGKLTF